MKFVYSHGGFAREIMRSVRENFPNDKIFFVDDNATGDAISYDEALNRRAESASSFVIGFADSNLRRQKTEMVLSDGFSIFSVQARTAIIGENVSLSAGAVVSDFTILTADAQIGHSFHCNIYSYVAHDCIVGDFVTLAPRVSVNGRVEIGDDVYIGTGATILPGRADQPLKIGRGAIIGAHSLVTKDVPENTVVIGAPAKPLKRRT
ncbi:acetyltransferase [Roseovarius sp. SCSIO 43702]|uniref:acetyltransferase n=1 Tax=Roseovarius sp. SCSIO 43702 TaxID=2823043 RepID=UPI001C732BB7|nr:acetyltransferase [Roseovarius sp. SCSIO 43702]QYX56783.1 acetyltransferase [Roseovarius sp. SCSIO 43702]